MKKLLLICLLALSGCATVVPVKMSFPQIPEELKISCPALKETDSNTTKLSEVLKVVTTNYGQYTECQIKVDAWIQWYDSQKKIHEDVR